MDDPGAVFAYAFVDADGAGAGAGAGAGVGITLFVDAEPDAAAGLCDYSYDGLEGLLALALALAEFVGADAGGTELDVAAVALVPELLGTVLGTGGITTAGLDGALLLGTVLGTGGMTTAGLDADADEAAAGA